MQYSTAKPSWLSSTKCTFEKQLTFEKVLTNHSAFKEASMNCIIKFHYRKQSQFAFAFEDTNDIKLTISEFTSVCSSLHGLHFLSVSAG